MHAKAKRVEIEIEYASDSLNLYVRDDGSGVEPQLIEFGRSGHWGLQGMRERADRIGGTLKLLSRINAGTEIKLTVPGRVAFRTTPPLWRGWIGGR